MAIFIYDLVFLEMQNAKFRQNEGVCFALTFYMFCKVKTVLMKLTTLLCTELLSLRDDQLMRISLTEDQR